MSAPRRERVLDADGPAAPPRKNGELLFATPWESRVFGIAVTLHEQGMFEWDEFRACLIAESTAWEQRHDREHCSAEWSYYACWQAALETLLARKGLCHPAELDARAGELASRPAGHDH
ncbi:MAG TPA: nitrile hydratase accessory protein [Candidatus Kryptonia bacterium]|nr:nitrile hydratase accessory protein [Candidatus Kryptonia bacterium]